MCGRTMESDEKRKLRRRMMQILKREEQKERMMNAMKKNPQLRKDKLARIVYNMNARKRGKKTR